MLPGWKGPGKVEKAEGNCIAGRYGGKGGVTPFSGIPGLYQDLYIQPSGDYSSRSSSVSQGTPGTRTRFRSCWWFLVGGWISPLELA